jgi:hypothetical protein
MMNLINNNKIIIPGESLISFNLLFKVCTDAKTYSLLEGSNPSTHKSPKLLSFKMP